MVRMRCGMGMSDALTLWKWRNRLLLNEHYSLKTEWNLSSQCVLLAWLWPLVMLNQSMNSFVKGNDRLILSSILLISSDNLSVGEESCESAIPWILNLISFVVISIILSTGIWNDHPDYSFSFLLIRKQSLFKPSSQTRQLDSFIALKPLQLNPLIWTLDSFLFTMQLSILMNNAIPESSYLKHEWIYSLYSLSPFYPHNHNLSNMSLTFIIMHSILPTQQWKYMKSYPTIATQPNMSLSHSIHPRIRFA